MLGLKKLCFGPFKRQVTVAVGGEVVFIVMHVHRKGEELQVRRALALTAAGWPATPPACQRGARLVLDTRQQDT